MVERARAVDEVGATRSDYALLVSGIAAVLTAAVLLFGGFVDDLASGGSGAGCRAEPAAPAPCQP